MSGVLLDTNVLSEVMRRRPCERVKERLRAVPRSSPLEVGPIMRAGGLGALGIVGLGLALAPACGKVMLAPGASSSASSATGGGSPGGGGQSGATSSSGDGGLGPGTQDGGGGISVEPPPPCPPWTSSAMPLPLDIVFVIDNSAGMAPHIVAVQKSINDNFSQIIQAAGVDYRVIMVTAHGKADVDQPVCVERRAPSRPPSAPAAATAPRPPACWASTA